MSSNKIDLYVSGPPEIDLSVEKTSSAMMAKDVLALKNRMTDMEQQHKTDITKIQEDKAEKGSTLSEYGIKDAYTKTETDSKISDVKDDVKTNYYNKEDIDIKLLQRDDNLQNAIDTYDGRLNGIDEQISEMDTEYVKNTDYATATKGGVVKIRQYSRGLQIDNNGVLAVYGADRGQITAKESNSAPVGTLYFDYAVSYSTHQDMSDDYDVSSLKVAANFEGSQQKLPVSYEAVKGYIDGITGDINTALDSILAIQSTYI